ncbi:hypothetical protein REPUB_Repub16aG0074500 [Reevesia pubescens]
MEKLKPWPKFYLLILLLPFLLLLGLTKAQQGYVNNQQLACEDPTKDNNITRGFSCNGEQRSCQSYITFRSEPPYYNTSVSIGYLLGAQATQISSLNNLSADVSPITPKSMVVVPVNCSCFSTSNGSYYQHNASYTVKFASETYFSISNDTYQGLTTCQAMEAQNPIFFRNLKVNDELVVPIRCACPTVRQTQAGAKYLLSYIVTWGDSIASIAKTFGADEKSILDANELTENDLIFPFTPLLVPLSDEPTMAQTSPPSAPSPQIPTIPIGTNSNSKSSNKWVFIGVGIGVGSLLLLGLGGFLFCFCRRQRQAHKARPIASSPPPEPPSNLKTFSDSANYTGNSWSVSISWVRYAIESLTPYKYEDLKAATGNFSESNRIEGSVFRGSFQGDAAAVKVMKGNVSSEINLLKKINHTNIIRLSGFCVHEGNTYLVYEYADKGSVSDWLHSNKLQTSFTLSWKQRVQIAYDVADALNYLHNYINPPYIHKNLKTSNILLDVNFRAKVANFGLARTIEDNDEGGLQLTRHVVGTQGYMAPEYIENGVITPKLDVFALGVIILELLSGKKAANAEKNGGGEELLSASIRGVLEGDNVREKLKNFIDPSLRLEYPLDLAFSMAQMAKICVALDLNARPSMSEVLVTLSKILSSSLDWDPSDEFQRSTSVSSAR